MRPFQHMELVPQREDLEVQAGARASSVSKRQEEGDQDGHPASLSTVGRNINISNKNRVFGRDSSAAREKQPLGAHTVRHSCRSTRSGNFFSSGDRCGGRRRSSRELHIKFGKYVRLVVWSVQAFLLRRSKIA